MQIWGGGRSPVCSLFRDSERNAKQLNTGLGNPLSHSHLRVKVTITGYTKRSLDSGAIFISPHAHMLLKDDKIVLGQSA